MSEIRQSEIGEIAKLIESHLDHLPDKPIQFSPQLSAEFKQDFIDFINAFFADFPLPAQHIVFEQLKSQWGMLKFAAKNLTP